MDSFLIGKLSAMGRRIAGLLDVTRRSAGPPDRYRHIMTLLARLGTHQ
jgi:hypothetical protein